MLGTAAAAWEDLQAKSCASTMDILNLIMIYTFSPSPMIKQSKGYQLICRYFQKTRSYRPYSNHILICMLGTAAATWENLQGQSCAGTIYILNLILIYTFSPSPMIKQSMVISPFADICNH
jgi:hypothetical protein